MPTPQTKPGRILVIEDDWDLLQVLKLMLEYEGHQVVTAKHGRAALAAAASKPFDLVIMDISMPEMSGIEVAQALRANAKTANVRIAIHTGLDEHWVRERFTDYDVFFSKANDADVLVSAIAKLLATPQQQRGEQAAAPEATFSVDDTAVAQRTLRAAMGLGPQAFAAAAFIGMLSDEIEQLRRLDKSDAEIARLIGDAVGKEVTPAMIERHYVSLAARRGRP